MAEQFRPLSEGRVEKGGLNSFPSQVIERPGPPPASNPMRRDASGSIKSKSLTPRQFQILQWLDENPSNRSMWTINGRELRAKDKFKDTNVLVVSGKTGSIHIAKEDNKALRGYITGSPAPDKIFGPNGRGKAALATMKDAHGAMPSDENVEQPNPVPPADIGGQICKTI